MPRDLRILASWNHANATTLRNPATASMAKEKEKEKEKNGEKKKTKLTKVS